MKSYPGDGRFVVDGNPEEIAGERRVLWKFTRLWHRNIQPGLSPKDEYWLHGTDRQSGARVQVHPRGYPFDWRHDLATETVARTVQSLALPYTVPVLYVGPGVVFAEPPPARPWPSLGIEAAAACALQACEVAARLHARGCGPLVFGPSHLRLVEENGHWQIRWLVPGVEDVDLLEALELAEDHERESDHPRWSWSIDPIQHDLWQIACFFFSLLAMGRSAGETLDPAPGEAFQTLVRMREEGPEAAGIKDAASLASLFAVLARVPSSRIQGFPVVRTLPRLYPDWDVVIADGEALLQSDALRDGYRDYVKLPLAAAYHQRASRAWARGEHGAALADVNRALELDNHAPYHTTRAVLLDALNRRDEARAAVAMAFTVDAEGKERGFWTPDEQVAREKARDVDRARAHLTRGLFALRAGSLDEAEADLRRAEELAPSALSTRALAAVARARS
ncbi:hypothetical protein [Polyangium jinanense]|uniref:Tetratricopeptide repeat protein n=1 Tax=Polyangium jinanense TaxID=2829994 RepID=A0A9X3XC61_9BACT|nr:hypothetical protein [Polyangium jinanense]MDC3958818.1 hypothetical protein [Polyangium jinanense]MDC3985201.1 hypothetical protein [Polyangium jinanense]